MEKAVESLEIMFQKAEADIEYLSRKLDFQLQSEDSLKDENNPIRLLKKIEEVKSEFSSIANDMSEIQKAQKEATDCFRIQLLTLTQMLEKLGGLVGETPDLEDTTLAQFEELSQLLGVSKSSLLPASYHHENSSPQGNEQEETCSSSNAEEEPTPVKGKPSDLKSQNKIEADTSFRSLFGQPILSNTSNKPVLLTRSNALGQKHIHPRTVASSAAPELARWVRVTGVTVTLSLPHLKTTKASDSSGRIHCLPRQKEPYNSVCIHCATVISVSAYDKRKSSLEFIEINTAEFMSVSDLVRGRVKLEDLNRTYRLLWQHFKEEGNKAPLTQKEMNNMGLRVSGATGEAKLKILRSLKLCEISRAGDVKLT